MTVHTKTCINAARMQMHLFHKEMQTNTLSNGPAFFPNAPSFISQLVPYQRRLELFFERT